MKKFFSLIFFLLIFASLAHAQRAEVNIQLNEQFFDSLLDAIFKNPNPPSFPIATAGRKSKVESQRSKVEDQGAALESSFQYVNSFAGNQIANRKSQIANPPCDQSIKLQREIDGVRTAVRFRDGKIYAPIAFLGNYDVPLIGCLEFTGWAETTIELNFDREKQALVGHAVVTDVRLSGTNGVGSSIVTKLVQSSLDKKMNPIQILPLEKVSFTVPVQNAGSVKMKAVEMRPEIANNLLNVHIVFEFSN